MSALSGKFPEHIWTMLMHKILQTHLLRAFVANLKIGAIYALYPESFCDKNLATRKVFATKILLSGKFTLFLTLPKMGRTSRKYSVYNYCTIFEKEVETTPG